MTPPASPQPEPRDGTDRLLVWASIVMLVMAAPLVFNLVGRLDVESRTRTAVDHVSTQVGWSLAKNAKLKARLEEVTSEAYVEQRARVEYRYVRKGEVAVIPVADQNIAQPRRTWLDDTPEPTR